MSGVSESSGTFWDDRWDAEIGALLMDAIIEHTVLEMYLPHVVVITFGSDDEVWDSLEGPHCDGFAAVIAASETEASLAVEWADPTQRPRVRVAAISPPLDLTHTGWSR